MGNHHYEVVAADETSGDEDVEVWLADRRRSWIVRNVAAVALVASFAGIAAAVVFKVRYDTALSRMGDLEHLEARIDELKAEQVARRADLERSQQSIAEARNELVVAQRQTQRAQCEAENARIDAEVVVQRVSCYKAISDYYVCDAKNSKAKADGSLLGALIGVGLVIATGGSSLLAVGGAAIGSAGSGNDECVPVQCELDLPEIESNVLAKHGLSQRVTCAEADRT